MRSKKTKTHTRNTSNKFRKNKSLRGGFQEPPPPSYNNTLANNQRLAIDTFISAFYTNAKDAFKKIGFGTFKSIDYSTNDKISRIIIDAIHIINRSQTYSDKEFIYSLFNMLFIKIIESLPPPYNS